MRWGALIIVAILSGCDRADPGICLSPPVLDIGAAERPDACAHRWAYRLARSDDPADVVALATLEACREPIMFAAQARLDANLAASDDTTPHAGVLEQVRQEALDHARYRVVQARAGNCDIN